MKKIISTVIALLLAFSCLFALVACDPENSKGKVADNTEHYDEITKSFKLTKEFEGKNFLTDGIGPATLVRCTDGDTTNFRVGSMVITIRYYSIDTPESTGGVEKWGYAASQFNKKQLTAATDIVLESSTGGRPEHDNYGVRWLGYVWYKTAEDTDYKMLNLELVENGYSDNKGVNTNKFPYWSYFDKAEKFAKSIELRTWSKLDDPLYSTDPVPMTIKGFWENPDAYFNSDEDVGSKVEFQAYLTSLNKTSTYTFNAQQYDPETGETYDIKVYAAYSSSAASKMKIGNLYNIIGTVDTYNGDYQITGISYEELMPKEGFTTVLKYNYYLTFNSDYMALFDVQYTGNFYSDLTVSSVSLSDGVLTIVGTANKLVALNSFDSQSSQFTFTVKVPAGYNNKITEGTVLKLNGLMDEAHSGQYLIIDYSGITIVE